MSYTLYPTVEEALSLHHLLIERFGGTPGVRDQGLLESALYRPQSGYYKSLSLQTAALMQSLAQNHAFVDGNKRMDFALSATFLHMNGYQLIVSADEGEHFVVETLIMQRKDLNSISHWLEKHMKPV